MPRTAKATQEQPPVKRKHETLIASPMPSRLNDEQKTEDAWNAIREYNRERGHTAAGCNIAPQHWIAIIQALHGYIPDQKALDTAKAELLRPFRYNRAILEQEGRFVMTEPTKKMNVFLVITTPEQPL
jgi:hypothetical protein